MRLTKRDKHFIEFVKQECKRHGVKCDLRNSKYVILSGNIKCSGWFDSTNKQLVVSMNRPDALAILVHEYAHLTQWQDSLKGKFDLWDTSADSLSKIDEWLSGSRIYNIKRHLAVARDLELDNEKRSVKLIKKYKLGIDIGIYIKRANAYVQFYNWMYYTRKWATITNRPYDNPIVIKAMSTRFNMRYDQLSKKSYAAFERAKI